MSINFFAFFALKHFTLTFGSLEAKKVKKGIFILFRCRSSIVPRYVRLQLVLTRYILSLNRVISDYSFVTRSSMLVPLISIFIIMFTFRNGV